ncbi:MAG: hypothetical protein ACTS6G_03330 [Candidatus Hodgkinia cicadicola]
MRRWAEANNVRFMFDDVASIKTTSRPLTIRTRSGKTIIASSVIIAMGSRYGSASVRTWGRTSQTFRRNGGHNRSLLFPSESERRRFSLHSDRSS